jgi:uncharacterized protein YcfL
MTLRKLATVCALLLATCQALAEDAAQQAGQVTLETVVVTARLRQEDAQAIPVSLSVVDATTLLPRPRMVKAVLRGLGET